MNDDLKVFARIGPHNEFRAWLEREKADAVRHLSEAMDMVGIHRAQGRLHLVEKQITLLDKARELR
jgi:hypothetical protein